jgi:hypothetical protein
MNYKMKRILLLLLFDFVEVSYAISLIQLSLCSKYLYFFLFRRKLNDYLWKPISQAFRKVMKNVKSDEKHILLKLRAFNIDFSEKLMLKVSLTFYHFLSYHKKNRASVDARQYITI